MSERPSPPPVLVVTGMHRSGTSFASSLVHAAGLFVGHRLLGADPTNTCGHFEDLDVLAFHQRLLTAQGFADHGIVDRDVGAPGPAFRAEGERLVEERRSLGRPWGFKDPRTTLFLDFWNEILPEARYLFVYRAPEDVIDSLYRRGDTVAEVNPPMALAAWIHFNARLRDFARAHPDRVLVREVSQLAARPADALHDLRDRLGIPLDTAATTFRPELLVPASADAAAFVRAAAPDAAALLADLRTLSDVAGDPHERAPPASAILDYGLRAWQRGRRLEAELAATRNALDHTRQESITRGTEIADERDRADALSDALREREAWIDALVIDLDHTRAETARGRHDRQLADARAAADRSRITALEAMVGELVGSSSWRMTAPVRAFVSACRGATGSGGLRRRVARLARTSAESVRSITRRCGSPSRAARSLRRAAAIIRSEGISGLVRALRTARAIDAHHQAPRIAPAAVTVRMPLLPNGGRTVPRGHTDAETTVSVLVPVFDTPAAVLEATLTSILAQTWRRLELVAVDDASSSAHVPDILARHAARDPRIRVHRRAVNGGIAAATNDALARAGGELVALVDHDDTLEPDAIERCVAALVATSADAVYTDQDTIDARGRPVWTFHKPDWSPEYLRHVMYVGHLLVVRRALAVELGGFLSAFDGVQDYEFMLRLGERTRRIAHVPEVLYHWRAASGSVAAASDAKPGIDRLQVQAVQAHLDRLGVPATAGVHPRFPHRSVITPRLTHSPPVSIVIPTKDRPDLIGPCLDSIARRTRYPDYEVVVVDTGTTDPEALAILREHPVTVVPFTRSFNFSAAANAGAAAARGEIIVFLNNDTTVISPEWLEHLVFHLAADDVGAVGPLLVYPDGSVQHAGVVLGARGTADHVMRRFPADCDGYAGSLSCPREVSAVTGACLAIRRDVLDRVGGWNELYATHYQDVDLCLRLGRSGLRCLFTPDVRLVHHESPTRGDRYDFLDRLLLLDTWREVIEAGDRAYPAACSLERLDYSPGDERGAAEGVHAR
jgi:GT2 family glycosyltransferase